MTGRLWRLIVFVALLLLTNVGAEAQKSLPSRVIKQPYRSAIQEISRTNPEAAEKLRRALLPQGLNAASEAKDFERVGAILRQHLKKQKFTLDVHEQGQQPVLTIRPFKLRDDRKKLEPLFERRRANEVLGRTYLAIARREEILEKMHVKEVRPLEVLRRDNEAKSELEDHLEKIGVTDYDVVSKSFDGNPNAMAVTLSEDVTLLRIFGGESKPTGRYLFCCLEDSENAPQSIQESSRPFSRWADASGLATPPGNLQQDLALVTVPAGTVAVIGTVADNFADAAGNRKLGGNTQIFLPAVKEFNWEPYRLAGASSRRSDIIVLIDNDKILRFREDR